MATDNGLLPDGSINWLQNKIAYEISAGVPDFHAFKDTPLLIAKRILDIPEIAEALALLQPDEPIDGAQWLRYTLSGDDKPS